MSTSICVVGSINMDIVVHAERFPDPGETILGGGLAMHPGGKGANQAVAASRMGANVSLVGCIGDDEWGSELRATLASEGVDISNVKTCEKIHTGVGVVTVVPSGENSIVVAGGANTKVTPELIEAASGAISDADVLILQAEIPAESNARAIEYAKRSNTRVVFNAAPAIGLEPESLRRVDLLVLNRGEAHALVKDVEQEVAPSGLARRLSSYGPERIVITLGAHGALAFNGTELSTFDAFAIDCVDSTAAGDAFVGALATMRAEGARLKDAVRMASAAGALAASCDGAIPSLPSREAVEAMLRREIATGA